MALRLGPTTASPNWESYNTGDTGSKVLEDALRRMKLEAGDNPTPQQLAKIREFESKLKAVSALKAQQAQMNAETEAMNKRSDQLNALRETLDSNAETMDENKGISALNRSIMAGETEGKLIPMRQLNPLPSNEFSAEGASSWADAHFQNPGDSEARTAAFEAAATGAGAAAGQNLSREAKRAALEGMRDPATGRRLDPRLIEILMMAGNQGAAESAAEFAGGAAADSIKASYPQGKIPQKGMGGTMYGAGGKYYRFGGGNY